MQDTITSEGSDRVDMRVQGIPDLNVKSQFERYSVQPD